VFANATLIRSAILESYLRGLSNLRRPYR
jgi:hypothetical protein